MYAAFAVFAALVLQNADVVPAPQFDTPIAITSLTLTTKPGETIEHATVLIEHGRFAAIGGDVKLPAGTRVVDGSGMFAYAGFIDGFTRAGVADRKPSGDEERRVESAFERVSEVPRVRMEDANRNGIYARRDVEDFVDHQERTYASERAGGFATGLLAPPRGILGGRASVLSLGDQPLRSSVVASGILHTASFTPPGPHSLTDRGRYPTTAFGVIAVFRQIMWDTQWLAQMSERAGQDASLEAQIPRDPDLLALSFVQEGLLPLAWEANDRDEILRVLRLADELKFKPMIVGGREASKVADRLAKLKIPVLASLKLPPKASEFSVELSRTAKEADDTTLLGKNWDKRSYEPHAAYDEANRVRAAELKNVVDLQNAGVVWCATSLELGKPAEVLASLQEIVEAGLSRDAALAALTTTPASLFACGDSLGTVEIGKRANLAILNKPLGDKDAKVRWTFVDGRQFDGDESASKGRDKDKKDKKDKKDDQKQGEAASRPADTAPASPASEPAIAASATTANAPATDSAPATSSAPLSFLDLVRGHEPDWPIETEADRAVTSKTAGNVLLKNAYVITVSGDDLPDTDVLVEKGRITKIGKNLTGATGVMSIDLTGYVLAPGVIDGHAHIALDSVNEGANSITCEVRCEDVIRSDDANIYRALAGGVTTMHLMHGSANTIGGECVLVKLKYGGTADDMIIKDRQRTVKWATGENVIRGGKEMPRQFRECCGDRPRRFPATRMGVEGTMRRALQAGKNYSDARAAYAKELAAGKNPLPFRRDIRLEALADIIDGKLWINSHCYRADEILRLLNTCEDFGVRVANLHHCLEAYRIIPEIVRHGCGTVTFADWWAYKIESYDAIPQNAGMLLRAGVNSTIKSDSPDLMRHLPLEAAKCMKFSTLTPNEALHLVTLNVARQFGLDKRTGSIDVGKDADLAVWEGHPLDTFSKPVLTLVEGEIYFRHRDFDPSQPRSKPRVAVRTFATLPPTTTEDLLRATAGAGESQHAVASNASGLYAITGGTVHPISGTPIVGGTVIIRDGKIESVGSDMQPPTGATLIDAKGLHVYPGLINAATEVGLREVDSTDVTVDVEESGVFMSDLAALSAFNPHSDMIEVTRAEGITSALIVAASNAIAGQAGLVHFDGWTMNEMAGEMKLGLAVALPFKRPEPLLERPEKPDFEGWNERPQRNERAYQQLAEIQTFFENAARYAAAKADPIRAAKLDIDPRFEAMIPYVRGEKPVLLAANSYKQILEALQFAHTLNLRPVILGGQDAWKLADLLAQLDVPVIYEGVFAGPDGVDGVPMASEAWDANYRAPAVMQAAGVQFCFGVRSSALAKLAPIHAGFAIAHGLDADAAMRALTLSAAEILGVSDRIGSIDPGKLANLIVTSDHPCQATNVVKYMFVRGKPVPIASEHTRDADKFANRPATQLPPERTDLKGPPSQSRRK